MARKSIFYFVLLASSGFSLLTTRAAQALEATCPLCSNAASPFGSSNLESKEVSPEGFFVGSGFDVRLSCSYSCVELGTATGISSPSSISTVASFLPLAQGLKIGDGGARPKESFFMYGSLAVRLSAWSNEVCLAQAEQNCGGALNVATSKASHAQVGKQIFALPLGVQPRKENVLSPFASGQETKPVSHDRYPANPQSQIAAVAQVAAATAMQDPHFGSLRNDKTSTCQSRVAVTVAYGDCLRTEDNVAFLSPAKPEGVVDTKESFCVDSLEQQLRTDHLEFASEAVLSLACESYFSQLAGTGRRFLGASCAAFRGDTQCLAWAYRFRAATLQD